MTLSIEQAARSAAYPLFIPFIMAGDPDPEATIDLALAMEEAGAHILELGIPYSDPLADGPVLQRSSGRAREHGMQLEKAMDLVPFMRKRGLTIPVVIFTYYNPVINMGEERFLNRVKECGADGVLIPDLPLEENEEFAHAAQELALSFISLVAPTSQHRIKTIAAKAQGFLYCVSSLGVTGTRDSFSEEAYDFIKEVKKDSHAPVAVGFGISKPEHVASLNGFCDGVIVGSAIMKEVEKRLPLYKEEKNRQKATKEIKEFVVSLISS